jgi:hypothetical protein
VRRRLPVERTKIGYSMLGGDGIDRRLRITDSCVVELAHFGKAKDFLMERFCLKSKLF